MSATISPSANKAYGVARVCEVWDIPRSTYYDWKARQAQPPSAPPRKPGPPPKVSDADLLARIREVLAEAEALGIRGEGHRKVWARLRFKQLLTTKKRVLHVMRVNGLLAPTRVGRPRGPRNHDGNIHTSRPDEMWGTDATQVSLVSGLLVWVFLAVDHCTGECIGIHASIAGTRFEALEPIRQGVREFIGPVERGVAEGLAVRHDHGSQYMSHHFQNELAFLGIRSSPSYVAQPEGNGVAERFVRTLKEQLLWVHHFVDIDELRAALQEFRATYNANWLVARHGHRTPSAVRRSFASSPSPTRVAA
jgi:putative transposase